MDISTDKNAGDSGDRSSRIFLLLLRAFPQQFRFNSAEGMAAVFAESLAAARQRGRLAVVRLWFVTLLDVLMAAVPERLAAAVARIGGTSPQHRVASPDYKGKGTMAGPFETFVQDLRYAGRGLARTPGFTLVAAVTIALGIGATTTIFSVANSILLRPLPGIDRPGDLITAHRLADDGSSFHSFGWEGFEELTAATAGLADFAAYSTFGGSLSGTGQPEVLFGLYASSNYFRVLGVRPALGRLFLPEDDSPTGDPGVAVLSHRTWLTKFGGDSTIVGRSIPLNGRSITVIGVAQEGFDGNIAVFKIGAWVPLLARMVFRGLDGEAARESLSLETVGRRLDGATLEQVSRAVARIAEFRERDGIEDEMAHGVEVRRFSTMFAEADGPVTAFMALLFVVSTLVLLIASVNVANMLLARATSRTREIALRQALGAGRWRIVRQMLTESVALFLGGGGGGIAISFWATGAFERIQLPVDLPIAFDFSPDLRVLGFTLAVALATGVVFGLAPALRVSRPDLSTALNSETAAAGSAKSKLRSIFVISQVAGTSLLLVGAALFQKSLGNAGSIDIGFDPEGLGVAEFNLEVQNYREPEARAFYDELLRNVAAAPGVTDVAAIDVLPLSLANSNTIVVIPGRNPVPEDGLRLTEVATVTPGYFRTMRIPLVTGREFGPQDAAGGTPVVVVNEEVANAIWPGENPVGRHLGFGSATNPIDVEIVGVARTGKYRSLGEDPRWMIYAPIAQNFSNSMIVVARRDGDAAGAADIIRDTGRLLDPELPVALFGTMTEVNGMALIPNRVAATIASLFGLLGMALGAVGLYGVLAYSVSRRTREIGVRMALGARVGDVRRLVVLEGLKLTAIGLAIGLLLAFGVTRFLVAMLYGVSPADPITFGGIAIVLIAVALLASYFPALRATRTDPMQALRYE